MRIALGLEYDGSSYCGWQSQPHGNTVQDVLQTALSGVANHPIAVIAAGRTDTGVHALEQVVHFDAEVVRPLSAWVRGVNALLPKQVSVLWAHAVPDTFHARFSAHGRSYRYLLLDRPVRPAIQYGKVGWFHLPLDIEAMRAAAQYLVGEHDFTAFRAAECQAKSPVKQLTRLDIRREGGLIVFELAANAFLHHMVRNLIGSLVYVGKGKYPPEWVREVLECRSRALAAPTFSPDGLYFCSAVYESKWELPKR